MDEREFKKHLRDLARGHHHPEEHDWSPESKVRLAGERGNTNIRKPAKSSRRKTSRKAK
jgi:hypothetical protein